MESNRDVIAEDYTYLFDLISEPIGTENAVMFSREQKTTPSRGQEGGSHGNERG